MAASPAADGERSAWIRDIDRRYAGPTRDTLLPDDDALLRASGGDYRVYDRLRADDRVAPAYDQRFSLLLDRPWEVVPGGEEARDREAAEHLGEALRALPWDTITEQMLWGVHYGHSIAECVWDASGPMVVPARILVRRRGRFWWRADRETGEWELLLRTLKTPYGEPMPARKFWTLARGADHADNPYGQGLARILYWLDVFKREELKFWLIYSDKYSSPTAQAKHRKGASEDEVEEALEVAKAVHGRNAVAVPEDMELALLETARSAAGDFEAFVRLLGEAQTRTVLTETMTSEDGSSRSQAQVHEEMLNRVVARDAYLIEESFARGPAKWLTEWNFPGAATPRVKRIADSLANQTRRAERDKLIAEMGWRPTREYVEETYDVRVEAAPAAPAPAAPPPAAAALAAPEAAERTGLVEQAMAAIDDEDWDGMAAPIVEPILRRAQDDPEGLLGDLAAVYPKMDSSALAERLARVLFVASIWGRIEAEEEIR